MGNTRVQLSLIGAGVVGATLTVCAARRSYRVAAVASRSRSSAERAVRLLNSEAATSAASDPDKLICTPAEAAARGELVLLAVPDDAIAPLAAELAATASFAPGTIFVHFSGALGSEALAPLAQRGALTASMHPMQTFPSVLVALDSLPGSHCFCEGEPQALTAVMQLASDIGCVPVELESDRKALYHAAACMACNYLATLQEAAIATAVLAGVGEEPARKAIAPLVAATVTNVAEMGPEKALTGPIARGDVKTVAAHLEALDATAPDLASLYRQLGRRTVRLAQKSSRIPDSAAEALMAILADQPHAI